MDIDDNPMESVEQEMDLDDEYEGSTDSYASAETWEPDTIGLDSELQQGDAPSETNTTGNLSDRELQQGDTPGESNTSVELSDGELHPGDTLGESSTYRNLYDGEQQQVDALVETNTHGKHHDGELQPGGALGERTTPGNLSDGEPRPEDAIDSVAPTSASSKVGRRSRFVREGRGDPDDHRTGQPWTPSEDALLVELWRNSDGKPLREFAKNMPGRSVTACQQRWVQHLARTVPDLREREGGDDPGDSRSHMPWTPEEDAFLLEMWRTRKTRYRIWVESAKHLPGRSGQAIRKRWQQTLSRTVSDR